MRLASIAFSSKRAALDQGLGFGLGQRLVEAVLGDQLGDEIAFALHGADFDLGELVPFGADVLAERLPVPMVSLDGAQWRKRHGGRSGVDEIDQASGRISARLGAASL